MASTSFISNLHLEPYSRLSPSHLHDELHGKTALVTGGGSGIGVSIARAFAEAGAGALILAGRTESTLKSTAADLSQAFSGTKVSYHVLDIASESSVNKLFASLSQSPDILVNNAGYLPKPENFATARLDEWWKGFTINVLGTMLVTQGYLRQRAGTNPPPEQPGVVVTMNTFGAFAVRAPNLSSYVASKAALARFLEAAAFDVPETTARFITVNPGAVRTPMFDKSELEGVADIPTTDVRLAAEFVAWAASEEAAFLNGRFAWANWDVDELVAKKGEILEKDLLISSIKEY